MYFNGVDQYVKVPNSAKLAFDDDFLTFEERGSNLSPTPYSGPHRDFQRPLLVGVSSLWR